MRDVNSALRPGFYWVRACEKNSKNFPPALSTNNWRVTGYGVPMCCPILLFVLAAAGLAVGSAGSWELTGTRIAKEP